MHVCPGYGRAREYSAAISQLETRQSKLWRRRLGISFQIGARRGTGTAAWHAVQIAKQAATAGLGLGFVFTWIGGVACRVTYSFPLVLTRVWVRRL